MGKAKANNPDLFKGTLDVLILKALSGGAAHGYTIATWIASASGDALALGEGTLYPALHRLEARGWLRSRWGTSANNRQAKFYTLTRAGETQLAKQTERWQRYATALSTALAAPTPTPTKSSR
jgi:PadR family transcriptional regulator